MNLPQLPRLTTGELRDIYKELDIQDEILKNYSVDIEYFCDRNEKGIRPSELSTYTFGVNDQEADQIWDMLNEQIPVASPQLDFLIDISTDRDFNDKLEHLAHYLRAIWVRSITNVHNVPAFIAGQDELTNDGAVFLNHQFIENEYDLVSKTFKVNYKTDYIHQNYHTIVIDTWGPVFKKVYNIDLIYEYLFRLLNPGYPPTTPIPEGPLPVKTDNLKQKFLDKYQL